MIYSKSLEGFFDPSIQTGEPPEDGIEISDEDFSELMAGLATGKIIVADESGNPVLADPPPWLFYAKSTGMFYSTKFQADGLPGDAVSITEEAYTALFEGQAAGKVIVADATGNPVLQDPPPPTSDEILAANTRFRDELLVAAALAIAPLQDAVDLDDATDEDAALLKKWKQYRVAVSRLDLTQASPAWPDQPA